MINGIFNTRVTAMPAVVFQPKQPTQTLTTVDRFVKSGATDIRFSAVSDDRELRQRMVQAQQAARLAGKIIMKYYQSQDVGATFKKPGDIVPLADKEGDDAIVGHLKKSFPDDQFFTEESSAENARLNLSEGWVIDPLDGTRNFTHKTGPFGVSIAYLKNGKPVVGVVYDPKTREMFRAVRGKGAFLNNRPIRVNEDTQMQKTTIVSTFFPPPSAFFTAPSSYRRLGSTAIDMAYVASGRLAAAAEKKLKAWDVAAGLLLIEEAGGKVTDLEGQPLDLTKNPIEYLGTNTKLHAQMQALLKTP